MVNLIILQYLSIILPTHFSLIVLHNVKVLYTIFQINYHYQILKSIIYPNLLSLPSNYLLIFSKCFIIIKFKENSLSLQNKIYTLFPCFYRYVFFLSKLFFNIIPRIILNTISHSFHRICKFF